MGISWIAALWGLAEATLFFIVPDVWLTLIARNNLRGALLASVYALAGALLGGLLLYLWGAYDAQYAASVVEKVPAISPRMMLRVYSELTELDVLAVLFGPLSGTPYKVYAVTAAHAGIGLWAFMLVSIPARLIRFVVLILVSHYAFKGLARLHVRINSLALLLVAWGGFYVFYFSVMPG